MCIKKDEDKEENYSVCVNDFYKEKEIQKFLMHILNVNIKRIISDLNNYIECGDWKSCIILINKLVNFRIFRYANEEMKKNILDVVIKKLLPNIYLYLPSDVEQIIELIYYTIKYVTNYKIDWKYFYTIFYITNSSKALMEYKIKLFIILHKFYPEDSVTLDEYKILKRTFFDDLVSLKYTNTFCNFIYFIPKKYVLKDDEFQLKLLYFLQNIKLYFVDSCCMFHKILRNNGKLFFSKDPDKNKEYIETFIKFYFTHLNLFIAGDSSLIRDSYDPYIPLFNKDDKKKNKFEKSVVAILIELLFNPNLKEFYSLTESHFKIILNNKHLYLKEKSTDAGTKNYINFLQTILYSIKRLFHDKIYDKTVEKFIKVPKKYSENKYLYDRLLIILKYMSLNLEKLFLYDNEGCCFAQSALFHLLVSVDFDDEYIKQVLDNINFEAYIKMIGFFKIYSETRMAKYIMKLYTIMPLLLSEYVFKNFPKVRELIKDSIKFLADNVSSANASVDIDILIIFGYEFFKIKDLSKKNKIYEFLIPVVVEATEKIMNNMIRILDLVSKKNYYDFQIFILSMKKFLGKEASKKISLLYANYIENNEVESSILDYYFLIIDEEEKINLFNHMYNDLLYIDDSNNIEINKKFRYPKFDKDFNIDVSKCSIEIFIEKQLQRYQKIFLFFDYSKILTNDKMVKKFYELYFALMNQKDNKFKKFATELFGFVINSILECKVDEKSGLIEYPSEYHVNMAIQMYEKIIIPYELLIIDYMKNNPKNLNEIKNNEIDNENKNNTSEKLDLEELLEYYMRLIHKVNIGKTNIILKLNFEQENLEGYKIIENQIKIYKKFKLLLKNSLKVIIQIYEYNEGTTGNYLFSNHSTNEYFDEILAINIKESSLKMEARKTLYNNINDIIFSTNLRNFLEFYMINKVRIANYNSFEIIQLIMPKEESYYTCLKLYLECINSVHHPQSIVTYSIHDFYSINKEKIQEIYDDIYNRFITILEKLKSDNFTEQNIMTNISKTFAEFTTFYISLFPYNCFDAFDKFMKIISLLKIKKFNKIDGYMYSIISTKKFLIQTCRKYINEKEKDKRYHIYYKKNEIIEEESNKIFNLLKENEKKNTYLIKYNKKIEDFIEKILDLLYQIENEQDAQDIKFKNINHNEVILLYDLLIVHVIPAIDKKSELFRKVVKFAFNNIILNNSPVSSRIIWVKRLIPLINEEYRYYENFEWVIFKSAEDYFKYWDKIKYEVNGKLYIKYPVERIKVKKFVYDEHIKINAQYNLNLESFLISMAEIDEYEEDQKYIKKDARKKISTLDEKISKIANQKFMEKKGLDFEKAKMFYNMFKLNYIDINSEYVKKINFDTELFNKYGKKIKHVCVTYEFILGKYEYMLSEKLFGTKERDELWSIMDKFTMRIDKVQDEKIYAFFHYIFKNYSLRDIEFIFDYDYFKYPIDLVADMYYLFHKNLMNLISETKIFPKEKTEELVTKIFSTEENIILDQTYLIYVLKIYYITNNMLKFNYDYFKDDYKEGLCQYYMEILSKCDTKYRRYGLYLIYIYFFSFLNNDLSIWKSSIEKMSLCIKEFTSSDNSSKNDKGKGILKNIGQELSRFNKDVDFPALCNIIIDILKKENDSNDTDKMIYLQTINKIYKSQRHLNLFKYSTQEIFDSLFKVFITIKNEELKKNFSGIFLSFFNDLSEEENKKFVEKYEKYIFEDEEDENKYNYIIILMNQLMRFKIRLPDYIQEFIIKLKVVNKKGNNKLKKIIVDALKLAMKYYQGSYIYMKENISEECKNVLEEMTKEKSYFV